MSCESYAICIEYVWAPHVEQNCSITVSLSKTTTEKQPPQLKDKEEEEEAYDPSMHRGG